MKSMLARSTPMPIELPRDACIEVPCLVDASGLRRKPLTRAHGDALSVALRAAG